MGENVLPPGGIGAEDPAPDIKMLRAGDAKEHVTGRKAQCRSCGRRPRGPREPGERRAGPAHTLVGSRAKAPSRVVTFQVQVSLRCSLCCHEQSFTLCTFGPFPGHPLTRCQCRPSATNACSKSLFPGTGAGGCHVSGPTRAGPHPSSFEPTACSLLRPGRPLLPVCPTCPPAALGIGGADGSAESPLPPLAPLTGQEISPADGLSRGQRASAEDVRSFLGPSARGCDAVGVQ